MAISTIGTDGLASSSVTSAKLASGAPSRAQLPAGTVLQVVQSIYSTPVSTTSTSYIDTGLSVSITPTSATSKILVSFSVPYSQQGGSDNGGSFCITKNGSNVWVGNNATIYNYATTGGTLVFNGVVSMSVLDSPASVSALTYKVQIYARSGSTITANNNNAPSTITLMEIAA